MLDRETIMDLKTLGWEKMLQKRYDKEARAMAEERAAEKAEEERAAKMGMTLEQYRTHQFREGNRAVAVPLSQIEEEEVAWLWPEKVARGMVTIFSGDPGLGKSFVTLDMAMRISRGREWPGEEEGRGEEGEGSKKEEGAMGGGEEGGKLNSAIRNHHAAIPASDLTRQDAASTPGGVILLSADDSRSKTIRPRLRMMGADLDRVRIVTHVLRNHYKMPFVLDRDMNWLKREIKELEDCQLVVLDPLSGYLQGRDGGKADARDLIERLSSLAEETNIAIVVVNHLRKGSGSAIHRSLGSISVIGRARAAWGFARCKEDPARRLMVPLKNNLAADQEGLAYSIIDSKVEWETEPLDISADEAFLPVRKARSPDALKKATEWLREKLSDGLPMFKTDILQMAERDGHSPRTLQRAKTILKVETRPGSYGGEWLWEIPKVETTAV